jgi:hypothetical protein
MKQTLIAFVAVLAAFLMGSQISTLSTSAGGFTLDASESPAMGFSNPEVAATPMQANCPVFDPFDNTTVYTCVRTYGSTDIEVGDVETFYFETYSDGFFYTNDSYTVTTLNTTVAKVSLSPSGSFTNSLTIPITRNAIGYAKSPNIYVKGFVEGSTSLWAYTVQHNNGNTLGITVSSPPPPSSELQSSASEIPVGWKQNMRINVQNAPNVNDTFRVTADIASMMLFSLSPSGPYSTYIDVPVSTNSDGNGATQYFYVKALQRTAGMASLPKITACANTLPCITSFSVKITNIVSVTLNRYFNAASMSSENLALDNNPNTGGGLRIFPEKKTPNDNADALERRYVEVTAELSEDLANRQIEFKVYDVDDPSSNDSEIDPNGSSGHDNRSLNYYFVESGENSVTASTDANGRARVKLAVGQQPGDNYRIAAVPRISSGNNSAQNNILDNVSVVGTQLHYETVALPASSSQPSHVGAASQMLTVWRRLHLERDSMGAVSGNLITGTVLSADAPLSNGSLDPSTTRVVLSGSKLDKDRFQKGRLWVYNEQIGAASGNFRVVKNTTTAVTVEGIFPQTLVGSYFTLWDDDDFNLDDGENLTGDNGEEIPAPDTSLLQDSDSHTVNKLAPAYIRPTYDLTGESGNVPFVLNRPTSPTADPLTVNPTEVRSMFAFNNVATEEDPDFWTVYVLNAYQPVKEYDGDSSESSVIGEGDDFGGQGVVLYAATFQEILAFLNATPATIPDRKKLRGYLVHEIGHFFNSRHGDGGVMCGLRDLTDLECSEYGYPANCRLKWIVCEDTVEFSPTSLGVIRSALAP